jgi:hypothetical protein
MNKLIRSLVLTGCTALPNIPMAQRSDSDGPDTPHARAFFNHLQQMLRANNLEGLANRVEYPMITDLESNSLSPAL